MNVTFYQRKPHPNHFSIEKVFRGVRAHLPAGVQSKVAISRFLSTGLFKRLFNTFEAINKQGDINHITGDIHYVSMFLDKKKTVLTIHDCGFMAHPSTVARSVLLWFWLKLPVWRSTIVTVVSESTKRDVIKFTNCQEERVRVIPDFVSPDYQATPVPNNSKPVLLQIGTKPNKNIPRVAQALRDLDVQLRIIGKLGDRDVKLLKQHGIDYSVAANLTERELIQEYTMCDMLLFTSLLEGFGMPIVEAQSIGRPVVTSNVSSMPEVAGEGACLVDPFDISAIKEGITRVLTDQDYRDSLVQKGFENVRKYQIDHVARQYDQLYQEVYRTNAIR